MTARYNETCYPLRAGNPDVAVMVGRWPIGATGAVGTKVRGKGMSLTRTGVGAYTIQLQSNGASAAPVKVMGVDVDVLVNDTNPTDDTDGHYAKLLALSDSAGTVTFQCEDETGTVREAPNGAVICVRLWVTNSDL